MPYSEQQFLGADWKHGDFPELKNDMMLRAAKGEKTERAPVWIMRQAGRYLPEFLEVRKSHSFFECCQTPSIASELTLQPIRRYSGLLDAAIIFCDILVVPQAMGMIVEMHPGQGPVLPQPLVTPDDLERLHKTVDIQKELGYVFEAIKMTRMGLKGEVPLIGFCGAPWTLMAYMVEGGGSKTFQKSKEWLYRYPDASKQLLARIADVCADLLIGQVLAGAQMVQVFDSWAGELTPYQFEEFALPPIIAIREKFHKVLTELGKPIPCMTLFAKGANDTITLQAKVAGYDTLGLDWTIDPVTARQLADKGAEEGGKRVMTFQGNWDPVVLYAGREGIEKEVERVAKRFRAAGGPWIANLGHGVTPQVKPEDFGWFLECVHKYTKQ